MCVLQLWSALGITSVLTNLVILLPAIEGFMAIGKARAYPGCTDPSKQGRITRGGVSCRDAENTLPSSSASCRAGPSGPKARLCCPVRLWPHESRNFSAEVGLNTGPSHLDICGGPGACLGWSGDKMRPAQSNRRYCKSNKTGPVKQGLGWSGVVLAGFRQVIDLVEAAGIEFASPIINVN